VGSGVRTGTSGNLRPYQGRDHDEGDALMTQAYRSPDLQRDAGDAGDALVRGRPGAALAAATVTSTATVAAGATIGYLLAPANLLVAFAMFSTSLIAVEHMMRRALTPARPVALRQPGTGPDRPRL
jgi:NAD(P)H-hydrate repair Nnr-like enzyme with NAD(P)H-hydrate dehydratase domain